MKIDKVFLEFSQENKIRAVIQKSRKGCGNIRIKLLEIRRSS